MNCQHIIIPHFCEHETNILYESNLSFCFPNEKFTETISWYTKHKLLLKTSKTEKSTVKTYESNVIWSQKELPESQIVIFSEFNNDRDSKFGLRSSETDKKLSYHIYVLSTMPQCVTHLFCLLRYFYKTHFVYEIFI